MIVLFYYVLHFNKISVVRLIEDTLTLYSIRASDFSNKMIEPFTKKDKEFKRGMMLIVKYHSSTIKY